MRKTRRLLALHYSLTLIYYYVVMFDEKQKKKQRTFAAIALFLGSACCDVEVRITKGNIKGRTLRSRDGRRYHSFTGIPFAKQPIGDLRFEVGRPKRSNVFGPSQQHVYHDVSGSGAGRPVQRHVRRHRRSGRVRPRVRSRRPGGLSVRERVHAEHRRRPSGNVLDSRRSVSRGPQRSRNVRSRLFHGQKRGFSRGEFQTRCVG